MIEVNCSPREQGWAQLRGGQMVFGRNSDRGSCGITNRLNWHLLRKHFTGVVVVVVVVVEGFHWKGYGGKDDDKVTEVRFTPGMK